MDVFILSSCIVVVSLFHPQFKYCPQNFKLLSEYSFNTENPFTLLFVLSTLWVHLNLTLGFYLKSKPLCKDSNTLLTEPTGVIKVLLNIPPKTF